MRLYVIVKIRIINIYDCIAISAIGYILTYIILGMSYSQHYLTPVYAFAIPFVFYYIKNNKLMHMSKILIITFLILQFGNISLGINDIIFQHYNNRNFNSVVMKLDSITKENYLQTKHRTTFFILGGQDQGNHFTYGTLYFMHKKGNTSSMFDFISFEKITDSSYSNRVLENPPYSFMNSNIHKIPKSGDYILFTPYTTFDIRDLDLVTPNYKLLKKWEAPSYFGYLNYKDIIRNTAKKT